LWLRNVDGESFYMRGSQSQDHWIDSPPLLEDIVLLLVKVPHLGRERIDIVSIDRWLGYVRPHDLSLLHFGLLHMACTNEQETNTALVLRQAVESTQEKFESLQVDDKDRLESSTRRQIVETAGDEGERAAGSPAVDARMLEDLVPQLCWQSL
jgi:hypothetical protein